MSTWQRFHLSDTVKAIATSDNNRFFIQLREPHGESRNPIEFYRWTLAEARVAGDRLVQAYYPHDCDDNACGTWFKLELSE
jgi:hypothetical protein